jgi:hypothetical protein
MKLLLALLLLVTSEAHAAKLVSQRALQYLPTFGIGSTSSVAYAGLPGTSFRWYATGGGPTTLLRLVTTSAALIKVGDAPTAGAADMLLPANTEMILEVISGYRVSAAPLTTGGSLFVTELIPYHQYD